MAIWDFSLYSKKDFKAILFHCKELGELGLELNKEMLQELQGEKETRDQEAAEKI